MKIVFKSCVTVSDGYADLPGVCEHNHRDRVAALKCGAKRVRNLTNGLIGGHYAAEFYDKVNRMGFSVVTPHPSVPNTYIQWTPHGVTL